MRAGERQVAPDISGIRRDHVSRYEWAARELKPHSRVIDLACGVGYGSWILAEAGHTVLAIDRDPEAIVYAKRFYDHPLIEYRVYDATQLDQLSHPCDAAICFETIEHLADPLPMLRWFRQQAPVLLASVPNEEKFPWRRYAFHFRHYRKHEFVALLASAGFAATAWWGQLDPDSEVASKVNGRTLIVAAKRSKIKASNLTNLTPRKFRTDLDIPFLPKTEPLNSVTLLGLGPSLRTYVDFTKRLGARNKLSDEVWGINAVIDIIRCDLGFHMDDVRVQQVRAEAQPDGNIAAMLPWLKSTTTPVYTSRSHPDYPSLIEYPLADVLNACRGQRYFNSTAAYAVAYALYRQVKKIYCFGFDFSYPNVHHAEAGRACVEFWLGMAAERGIVLSFPKDTTLLDANVDPKQRLYGYDTVDVVIDGPDGAEKVKLVPHDRLPAAQEIEDRYNHDKHPNPLARGAE